MRQVRTHASPSAHSLHTMLEDTLASAIGLLLPDQHWRKSHRQMPPSTCPAQQIGVVPKLSYYYYYYYYYYYCYYFSNNSHTS
jgi:hypothetical protein